MVPRQPFSKSPSWSSGHSREESTSSGLSSQGAEPRRADVLKLLLYDLNSAIAPAEHRIMALEAAIREFAHNEESLHDEELDLHADKILLQKLAFSLRMGRESEETAMVCTALELIFRASRARIALSFAEVKDCLLPLLCDLLGKPKHLLRQEERIQQEEAARAAKTSADTVAGYTMATEEVTMAEDDEDDSYTHQQSHYQQDEASSYPYDDAVTNGEGTYYSTDDRTYDSRPTFESRMTEDQTYDSRPTFESRTVDNGSPYNSVDSGPTFQSRMTEDQTYDSRPTFESRTVDNASPYNTIESSPTFETGTLDSSPTFEGATYESRMYEVETVTSDYESEYTSDFDGSHHVKQHRTTLETVEEASHEASSSGRDRDSARSSARSSLPSHQPSSNPSSKSRTATTDSSVTESDSSATSVTRSLRQQLRDRDAASVSLPSLADDMVRVEPPSHPVAVARALQIIRYISRVLSAMVPLAHHPMLLDALVYQLDVQPYGRYAHAEMTECRLDAVAVLVNLACAEENKPKLVQQAGLLDAVLTMALRDPSEEVREHCAIVLMNLAYADENKIPMVKHKGLLDTLVDLIQAKSAYTRRYASAAMFTLACVVANTERMATHCDGEILEALRRVLADDPVDEARMNASEAIFNMTRNNTEAIAEYMASRDSLLETLARAVLTDYKAEVRVFCARALEWLSADVHHPMSSHPMLLSALTAASQWTKTNCIAEAMKTQATIAENRIAMAKHNGLLEALANLALLDDLKDADVRMSAVAALELISRDPTARKFMVQNELVMMALTRASFEHGGEGEDDMDGSGSTDGKLVKAALKNLADSM